MNLKKKIEAATAITVLTAASVAGSAKAGEKQQPKKMPVVQAMQQGEAKDLIQREYEGQSPAMSRFFEGQDVIVNVGEPEGKHGSHFPRSPVKYTQLKYTQTVEVSDKNGKRLAEEYRAVSESSTHKLFYADPDTRQTKYTSSYYDSETGEVCMTRQGVRTWIFNKDLGHGFHEQREAKVVTVKDKTTNNYTGSLDKAPWATFIKVVNGDITEGVTKTVKKGKTVYVFEDAKSDPEAKTTYQQKSILTVKRDGTVLVQSVFVNTDQSAYPQTASVNYTSGKMSYQMLPDGQVSIQAKMTERDRVTQETPCHSLETLVKRFVRRWAKKVGMVFILPYPSTTPTDPHGKSAQQKASSVQATQVAYVVRKPAQPKEFSLQKGHFYDYYDRKKGTRTIASKRMPKQNGEKQNA